MPSPSHTYDFIVAGGGCAGLSFVWHLLESPLRDARVLLIDRALDPALHKAWCFWGPPSAPFAHLARTRWDRLRVAFPGGAVEERLAPEAYYCIRSADYFGAVHERLRTSGTAHLLEAPVEAIEDGPDGATVRAGGEAFHGRYVFQSLRPAAEDRAQPKRAAIRQHFGGWEVEAERAAFDAGVATLMDFEAGAAVGRPDATVFFYVLPFTPTRALVECTAFSQEPWPKAAYDAAVRAYLARRGIAARVLRREYGQLPMDPRRLSQRSGRHVFNIGTAGGMMKPTTGYTFQRTHRQVRHLVRSLCTTGRPEPADFTAPRFRWYDLLLLHILRHRPAAGPHIFQRLFAGASIPRVLTFLDERSGLRDEARIFARLPWGPFLRAAATTLPAVPSLLRPAPADRRHAPSA